MQAILRFPNLERFDPIPQIGPNINQVLADSVRFGHIASGPFAGCITFNMTGPAGCGGLLTWKLAPPINNGVVLNHVRLEWDQFTDAINFPNWWRNEGDIKIVVVPAATGIAVTNNIINLSTQGNASKGWAWQIDNAQKQWTDTGAVMDVAPDVWSSYAVTGSFDTGLKTFSVEALASNGNVHPVPPVSPTGIPIQLLPWQSDRGWGAGGPGLIAVQLQIEQQFDGGFQTVYRNIHVICSDQPLA